MCLINSLDEITEKKKLYNKHLKTYLSDDDAYYAFIELYNYLKTKNKLSEPRQMPHTTLISDEYQTLFNKKLLTKVDDNNNIKINFKTIELIEKIYKD